MTTVGKPFNPPRERTCTTLAHIHVRTRGTSAREKERERERERERSSTEAAADTQCTRTRTRVAATNDEREAGRESINGCTQGNSFMSTGTLVDVRGLHGHDLTPGHIVFERRVRAYYARALPPPLSISPSLSFSFVPFNVVASSSQDKGSGEEREGAPDDIVARR